MEKDAFKQQLTDHGYDESEIKVWEPNLNADMHTHDFSVMLLVTEGVFELALEDGSTHYRPGEWCELPAGTLHSERTGADGAKGIIAKKAAA